MTRIDGNLLELKGRSCQAVARETLLAFCTTASTRAAKPRCGCGCRNRASQTRCDVHKGGKFGCTPSREARYLLDLRLSRVEHNASARTAPVNGSAGFVFRGGGAFSDLRKGHQFPKIRKPTKWPTGGGAFSDQGGKKTIGGSVSNALSSDGLTKRPKCVSAAAASSGFARVQDRAFTWVFGMPHSKACI